MDEFNKIAKVESNFNVHYKALCEKINALEKENWKLRKRNKRSVGNKERIIGMLRDSSQRNLANDAEVRESKALRLKQSLIKIS